MAEKPIELSVNDLFLKEEYVIPLYQRNYAWDEAQVVQLIQDVWDNIGIDDALNYYIGTLVVFARDIDDNVIYETIDGQQRLTTLNILLSVLSNEFGIAIPKGHESKLRFDSRKISSDTLKILSDKGKNHKNMIVNTKMDQAYRDMEKKLGQLRAEKENTIQEFADYLLNRVKLLQVEVPKDTDLNHYFEIMNNRGEQLEKHEILKAELLNHLKKDKNASTAFAMIWDACSNMDRYMQFGFKKNIRDVLFEDDINIPDSFATVADLIFESGKLESKVREITLLDFITEDILQVNSDDEDDDNPENARFTPIINFSNFLLHVLRVYTQNDVPLDDKRLIPTFSKEVEESDEKPADFVMRFAFALFECRFLYDRYIIKREITQNGESWSLKTVRTASGRRSSKYFANTFSEEKEKNKQAVMLLSMFHVSFPQLIYKHWLSGVLNYLYYQESEVDPDDYITYLEELSDAFYYDRFSTDELDYYEIIFENEGRATNSTIDESLLHYGSSVQNFIFNRLDYLIWKSLEVDEEDRFDIDNVGKFEFSPRSSVEHYYPQHPKSGTELAVLDKGIVDRFGNLCLISRSKNSELSNYSPLAKAEHYEKLSAVESLKQQLMMQKKKKWDQQAILDHEAEMIDLLNGN